VLIPGVAPSTSPSITTSPSSAEETTTVRVTAQRKKAHPQCAQPQVPRTEVLV
jgi:hypothetical protein